MAVQTFGFVGLGAMGQPIARSLAESGIDLVAFDLDAHACRQLLEAGAQIVGSVEELARSADCIFACLPTPVMCLTVAAQVANTPNRRARVYAEMSTTGLGPTRQIEATLASGGVLFVDAPISGGPKAAEARQLTCFAAGPDEAVEALRPAYAIIAKNFFHLGRQAGAAQMLKLGNNLLAATNLAAASEVVRLLEREGIDPKTAIEAINVSTGRSRATEVVFVQEILTERYSQGAKLAILAKDTSAAIDAADEKGVPMTVGRTVRNLWTEAGNSGLADEDFTRIYDWIGKVSGK